VCCAYMRAPLRCIQTHHRCVAFKHIHIKHIMQGREIYRQTDR